MSIFEPLEQQVVNFRDARNWKPFHGAKDLILGLLVELGELAEHFQYLKGTELKKYQKDFKEEIADEMADVLFWLVLMSADLKIDLEQAFKRKMAKNAQKYPPGKHGKLYNRWQAKKAGR